MTAALVVSPHLAAQTPTKGHTLFMDEAPMLPGSLAEMWRSTPLVLHVRVLAQGPPELDPLAPQPRIMRYETASVLEVLRSAGPMAPGDTVKIIQFGGSLVVNGVEEQTVDSAQPLLVAGQALIVFLNPYRNAYTSHYGGSGLLRVEESTGSITVPFPARNVKEFVGRTTVPADDVLRVLRTVREQNTPAPR